MRRIDLDAELAALESMPLAELRSAWTRHVRTTPPRVSANLLRLALAHHLQSKVLGGCCQTNAHKSPFRAFRSLIIVAQAMRPRHSARATERRSL